jgi:hypothetical protein
LGNLNILKVKCRVILEGTEKKFKVGDEADCEGPIKI